MLTSTRVAGPGSEPEATLLEHQNLFTTTKEWGMQRVSALSERVNVNIYRYVCKIYRKKEKDKRPIKGHHSPDLKREFWILTRLKEHTETKIPHSYVFPEKELRGLRPNFHIHVSVSDLYSPRIRPHILLQQNKQPNVGI